MTYKIKKARVLKSVSYQTGQRKSIKKDRQLPAKLSGKRRSESGNIYWETRKNRTDLKGKRI